MAYVTCLAMAAQLIDGKALAKKVRQRLKADLKKWGQPVGLGALLDATDAPSKIYVGRKERACSRVGIHSKIIPVGADEAEILARLDELNRDESIHGILVQLPLPKGVDQNRIIAAVDPRKDADGLHPVNLGRLMLGDPTVAPCTPAGVMEMLKTLPIELSGKEAVVIGRSMIVGKPMAQLLSLANATVTICHSKTKNLSEHVKRADIVVAAVGRAHFVKGGWIKPGAVVIDVGINRLDDGTIVGDVEFAEAARRASFITPVPGGVGPMTVAMLLANTLALAKAAQP